MALTPNVVSNTPITSAWGNEIRDRTVQKFATAAERTAQWPAPPVGAVSTLATNPNTLYVWTGAAWVSGGGAPARIEKQRTSGHISLTTAAYTNWTDLDNATFQTQIAAAVGDEVEINLDGSWSTVAGGVGLIDVYGVGSAISWGTSAPGTTVGLGLVGAGGHAIAGSDPFNATAWRAMTAGDIVAGQATIRVRARTSGGTQILLADATSPLTFTVRNLGGS